MYQVTLYDFILDDCYNCKKFSLKKQQQKKTKTITRILLKMVNIMVKEVWKVFLWVI